jgi:hypothetical protein
MAQPTAATMAAAGRGARRVQPGRQIGQGLAQGRRPALGSGRALDAFYDSAN